MTEQNPVDQEQLKHIRSAYESNARLGVIGFYLIGVLTIINSLIHLFVDARINFLNLGVTELIDIVNVQVRGGVERIAVGAFVADIAFASLFMILGYAASRGNKNAYGFIPIYGFDGILAFILRDFGNALFHFILLTVIASGLKAVKTLDSIDKGEITQILLIGDKNKISKATAPTRSRGWLIFWIVVGILSLLFFIWFNYSIIK
jgi:hypothetical protein